MCWSRLTLDCDGTRPGKKNWLFLRFPEEALNTKDTARQRRDQKKCPPLPSPPSRGREERGLSATCVHGVWSDNERPKDSHKPGKILSTVTKSTKEGRLTPKEPSAAKILVGFQICGATAQWVRLPLRGSSRVAEFE